MLASSSGLTFLSVLNSTEATEFMSSYPDGSMGSLAERQQHGYGMHSSDSLRRNGVTQDVMSVRPAGSLSSGAVTSQVWWKHVSIQGRLADINRAIEVLTYWPDINWNSYAGSSEMLDNIVFEVDNIDGGYVPVFSEDPDGGLPGAGPSVLPGGDRQLVRVRVVAVNDAPVLSIPGSVFDTTTLTSDLLSPVITDVRAMVTDEGQSIHVPGITVRDIDVVPFDSSASPSFEPNDIVLGQSFDFSLPEIYERLAQLWLGPLIKVNISASLGTISLKSESSQSPDDFFGSSYGLSFDVGSGAGDEVVVFRAPIQLVNFVLKNLTFHPAPYYFGAEAYLHISVNDLGNSGVGPSSGLEDFRSIRVVVRPVNNDPEILVPSDFGGRHIFTLDEGSFIRIEGAFNSIANPSGTSSTFDTMYGGAGFELWRLRGPDAGESNWGIGSLELERNAVADINIGHHDSHMTACMVQSCGEML
jgi:hypothetical protein